MQPTHRSDHSADAALRGTYRDWLARTHGVDLGPWEERGCWTERYRPHGFVDEDGRVLASVAVYELELVVDGERVRAAQLSGVGTEPEHRRKGWSRTLTEHALAASPGCAFVFLFADDDARPYYRRLGFEAVEEHRPVVPVRGRAGTSLGRRLDPFDPADWDLLRRYARERAPVSDVLGALDAELLLFHALAGASGAAWHHADLDLVLFAERDGPRLVLHDVVGLALPDHERLARAVAGEGVRELAFSFVPDRLGLAADDVRWEPLADSGLHLREPFPLADRPFLFPRTARA